MSISNVNRQWILCADKKYCEDCGDKIYGGLTMAEYIEREKAKRLLHIEYAYAAEQLLDEIPAADVAPVVHGRWIGAPIYGNDNCRCSECGSWHNIHANWRGEITQKYCPNCGAKMDGGAD